LQRSTNLNEVIGEIVQHHGSRGFLALGGSERRWYNSGMREMRELGHKGLPRAIAAEGLPRPIPAKELEFMLEASPTVCSCVASGLPISESITRWPFLFSRPLMGTN
jgi:hypothetical protein